MAWYTPEQAARLFAREHPIVSRVPVLPKIRNGASEWTVPEPQPMNVSISGLLGRDSPLGQEVVFVIVLSKSQA